MVVKCVVCGFDEKHCARGMCERCYKKVYSAGKIARYPLHDGGFQRAVINTNQVKQQTHENAHLCFICREKPIRARGMCPACYKRMNREGKINSYDLHYLNTKEEVELWAALQGMEQRMCASWAM